MTQTLGQMGYEVQEAGWALFSVQGKEERMSVGVSYLHDSLGDLAQMALAFSQKATEATGIFMQEPGEVQLVVRAFENSLLCELRNFRDWASWGMAADDDFEVLMRWTVSRSDFVRNVHDVLERIVLSIGTEQYKERWVEHEFPSEAFQALALAVKENWN